MVDRIESGDAYIADALYGIFTSGSTGTPKAIVVSHGAVSRFVRHFTEIFEITSCLLYTSDAADD